MSQQLSQSLADLASALLVTVEDRYYRDCTVNLDGYEFVNCRFDRCMLATRTGHFRLKGCVIHEGSASYGGPANNIVKLYNRPGRQWTAFASASLCADVDGAGNIYIPSKED